MQLSELVTEQLRPIRAAYWDDIRDLAAEIVADNPDDEDAREQAIHETADGSEWVIYTRNAYLVALVSDNSDAMDEVGGEATGDGIDYAVTAAAFYAVRADLTDAVSAIVGG